MKNKDINIDKSWELAFYTMFSSLAGKEEIDASLRRMLHSSESKDCRSEIARKVLTWKNNAEFVDRVIETRLHRGSVKDLAFVALAALRLGISEMQFNDVLPPEVSINEAVKLAKTYGDPDLAGFVNGIMDSWLKAVRAAAQNKNDKPDENKDEVNYE